MIDRYQPDVEVDGVNVNYIMSPDRQGDYVAFVDYELEVNELTVEVGTLSQQIIGLEDEVARLTQLLEEV